MTPHHRNSSTSFKYYACILVVIFLWSGRAIAVAQQNWQVTSPNKDIQARITSSNGKLSYSVALKERIVIEPSPLGLDRSDRQFSSDLKLVSTKERRIDESYTLIVGKKLRRSNAANELELMFENPAQEHIAIIFRAYQDGVAFRYQFPDQDSVTRKIISEKTGFKVPAEATSWIEPYDLNVRKKPCYETYYENAIKAGMPSPNPAGWAFPALFNIGSDWVLVTESGLNENYCASHLEDKMANGLYTIRFPESEEVTSSTDPEPVSKLPWFTPWRIIVAGNTLAAIQETTLVTDVSPPAEFDDTSWIKPGRASWSWWSVGSSSRDYDAQLKYIDFTASMGWEYVLIDAGWPAIGNEKVQSLVDYGKSKNVGIFLWYHSGMGRENDSLTMANLMAFPEARKTEMQKISGWGVKGIKVDFFDSDKQPVIQRYIDILHDAAAAHLMVNFHGSTLPRGWERTFPHLMSMESVKGAEGYGRQIYCDKAPVQNTILPFTRNVVGPMDYTPVTFTNKREAIRKTTFGHELALSIVFESGVFHFADNMNSYESLAEAPKNFLKNVPVTWDETRYVAGIPGQFAVVARRKGDVWYLGGINGLEKPLEVTFELPFKSRKSALHIITDGNEPGNFSEQFIMPNGKPITIKLLSRGGFVGQIKS